MIPGDMMGTKEVNRASKSKKDFSLIKMLSCYYNDYYFSPNCSILHTGPDPKSEIHVIAARR